MLELTIRRSHQLFKKIDPGAKWNDEKHEWVFSTGFIYQFGHCKDPGDWEQYQSNQYTWIGYDELVQFTEEQYDQINTRLRSSDPVLRRMLRIRAMSNPMMKKEGQQFTVTDPNWVRRLFVDPAPNGKETLKRQVKMSDGTVEWKTRIYLPAKLSDNPDPEFRRSYEFNLASAKPHIKQALLFGNWYVTAGSFYGDVWNQNLHIVKAFAIPPDWRRFRSMDWGFKSFGCIGWYAMDEDENLYKEFELTFREKTDIEVAKMIRTIEEELDLWEGRRSLISGPADPQLWEKRGESAKTKADVMLDNGVEWFPAGKDRQASCMRLWKQLAHDEGTRQPGLVFFDGCCPRTVSTLPMIQTSDKNAEEAADGGEDHWHDETRYAVDYASGGRSALPRVLRKKDLDEPDDGPVKKKRRKGFGYGGL